MSYSLRHPPPTPASLPRRVARFLWALKFLIGGLAGLVGGAVVWGPMLLPLYPAPLQWFAGTAITFVIGGAFTILYLVARDVFRDVSPTLRQIWEDTK